MTKLAIMIGADPELFMVDSNGKFVSAHGAIPGNKKDPFKVDKGAVQVDGMALEFNIDPAKNADEFAANLNKVMQTLKGMIPGYDIAAVPVAEFGHEYIKAQPAEALELGCDPDFNAWNDGAANPRPNADVPFRTGAGHVHIGWGSDFSVTDPDHLEACIMLTKQLDYYLGLPSLLFDEEGAKRRELYGDAGAFRPKPYGVEYRVLSNAWLKSEELMKWVFNTVQKAVDDLMEGKRAWEKYNNYPQEMMKKKLQDINKDDIAYVCQQFGITAPPGWNWVDHDWGDFRAEKVN